MACFIAPMTEAIIVTFVKMAVDKRERQALSLTAAPDQEIPVHAETKISLSRKLSWLKQMLWGGVFLLALEHVWHGEVVPYFPFLTAMNNPADIKPMLMEIATVGTSMAIFVTLIWVVMIKIADKKVKMPYKSFQTESRG